MANKNPLNSGDGTRPMTDGAVDNVGAGGGFDPQRPDSNMPSPQQAAANKADKASVDKDDSDPLGLHDAKDGGANTEPVTNKP